jgi:DNA-binding CsgD family transcriptional regulator
MDMLLDSPTSERPVPVSHDTMSAPVRHSRASGTVRVVASRLEALERALHVLLSPMAYPDWRSWRRDAHQRLLELTGAERMALYTPLGSDTDAWCVPGLTTEWSMLTHPEPGSADAVRQLSGVFAAPTDVRAGAPPQRQDGSNSGIHSHHTGSGVALSSQTGPSRVEIGSIEVDFGGGKPAVLAFTDGRRHWWRPDAERVASLKAVLPALRHGLMQWRKAADDRTDLVRFTEALSDAVFLFDRGGTLLHANEHARILAASPNGARVRGEAQQVAWAVDAAARRARTTPTAGDTIIRELTAGDDRLKLRGIRPPESIRGADAAVLVIVAHVVSAPLTDDDLRARFGLTPREAEVTRLVAEGLSNQEIADRLSVSFFTARNHVERLLVKLGVGNRARVSALLTG